MDASDPRRSVAAAAARWFVELDSGELSRRDREEFVAWLRESPVHIAEFLRISRLHGALSKFEGWDDILAEVSGESNVVALRVTQAERAAPERVSKAKWRLAAGLAATFLVLAVVVMTQWSVQPDLYVETRRGERRDVVLTDGSTVLMGPGTRLKVRYRRAQRDVELLAGRALFKVAKEADRPFVVSARNTTVRAVGTQFGVEYESRGDLVVTVAEGRVAVKARAPLRSGQSYTAADDEVLLDANQQLTVSAGMSSPVRIVDGRSELGWAQGRLMFENRRIADVVERFNEYNDVQLRVRDEALAERRVSGVFDASDPDAFIAFLSSVAGVQARRTSNDAVLLEPPAPAEHLVP